MPTLVYCDGFEHVVASANDFGGVDGVGLFDAVTNVAQITFPTGRNGKAIRIASNAVVTNVQRVYSGADPAIVVHSIYIRLPTSLPTAEVDLMIFSITGTDIPRLRFENSSGKFEIQWGSNIGGSVVGPVLVADTWYRVDLKIDVSVNPNTFSIMIDGGTEVTLNRAQAASVHTQIYIGTSTAVTYTADYDDWVVSQTGADYPLGAHKVIPLFPNGDGTHSFTPAGDFLRTTTSMDPADTTGWLEIDDWITGVAENTTYIADALGVSTEYTEFTFDDTTEGTIWAAVAVAAMRAAAATAANATCKIVDSGGTDVATIFSGDPSEVVLHYRTVLCAANPTQATVNGYKLRWGLSTDVNPDPWLSAAMIQIAVPVAEVAATSFIFKTSTPPMILR